MTMKTQRRLAAAALCLGFAVLDALLLLTILHWVGTDDGLYYSEQARANVLRTAGISAEDLRLLDRRLAACLGGDAGALDVAVRLDGMTRPAFNARERSHMEDCLRLFALLRKVCARMIPWAVVLILGGAWALRDRRRARRCAWLGPLIVLLPLGAFALYAAVDFDRAFRLFHHLLFRNDLWLLDPRTDLLIRICPESMFMHMGARIAVCGGLSMLAVSAAATLLASLWPRGRGKDTWKTTTRRGPAPRQFDFGNRGER